MLLSDKSNTGLGIFGFNPRHATFWWSHRQHDSLDVGYGPAVDAAESVTPEWTVKGIKYLETSATYATHGIDLLCKETSQIPVR